MEPSILKSVKKMLGIPEAHTEFDPEIIMFINSAFSSLSQLGIGPSTGIVVEDDQVTWDSLNLTTNAVALVRIFIYLKVRMLFDPPATSFLIDAVEKQIKEQEWRLREFHDETAAATYAEQIAESEVIL
jgi:hypothetical protein